MESEQYLARHINKAILYTLPDPLLHMPKLHQGNILVAARCLNQLKLLLPDYPNLTSRRLSLDRQACILQYLFIPMREQLTSNRMFLRMLRSGLLYLHISQRSRILTDTHAGEKALCRLYKPPHSHQFRDQLFTPWRCSCLHSCPLPSY